ncbi:MAG: hypothetical protein JW950_12745 [Deltaproteobacteria bacterium]|nr:hypothetical protein [Deltaproteobacteria bacterium]
MSVSEVDPVNASFNGGDPLNERLNEAAKPKALPKASSAVPVKEIVQGMPYRSAVALWYFDGPHRYIYIEISS